MDIVADFFAKYGPLVISLATTIIAIVTIWKQTDQQRTNLLFNIYKEERGIRAHISNMLKKEELSDLDAETFFNHFEMLAYLVNKKKIKEEDVRAIFLPGIKAVYLNLKEKEKIKGDKYKEINEFIERIQRKL
ncbi:MAG: hypothetical protein WC624_00305 [Candidatus Margulisiibacteriota bacterium]